MTCRAAPASAKTCAASTSNGSLLTWDNKGAPHRLAAYRVRLRRNIRLEEAFYDGAGQRLLQLDERRATTAQYTHSGASEDLASE